MIPFDEIESAKHIAIRTCNNSFANANALYSYVLSRHKKVSLIIAEKIDAKFSFLPWYDKQRDNLPASSDLVIDVESDAIALFEAFKDRGIPINQKMATSLYTALLIFTEGFLGVTCNGTAFAAASELISLGAKHLTCKEYLFYRESLAMFRLRSLMYANMLQHSNAQIVDVYISDEDLHSSGVTLDDAYTIQKEMLRLVHVKEVRLIKRDENNKILKTIKELELEK